MVPPGKEAAQWHQPGDRSFLGIDRTAIAVVATAAFGHAMHEEDKMEETSDDPSTQGAAP